MPGAQPGGNTLAVLLTGDGDWASVDKQLERHVQVTDATDGELLRAIGPVRGPVAAPQSAVDELSCRVVITVVTLFRPKTARGTPRGGS